MLFDLEFFEYPLNCYACHLVVRCVCVWICLCWSLCVLWGWCGMEVSSVRSHIQAHAVMWRALSRDNHKATQVQLPSVLFFFSGTDTRTYRHTHSHIHWCGYTAKHIHTPCKLTHGGGNPHPLGWKPQDCAVPSKQTLPPTCWLSVCSGWALRCLI